LGSQFGQVNLRIRAGRTWELSKSKLSWVLQISGHGRNEIASVLFPVGLAELDPRYLSDGVGLIGWLQEIAEQIFFPHRLGALPGIDTGTAEIKEFFHFIKIGRMYNCGMKHHVVIDELGRPGGIGPDAAHGPGHQEDVFRAVGLEPVVDGRLVAQVSSWSREAVRRLV